MHRDGDIEGEDVDNGLTDRPGFAGDGPATTGRQVPPHEVDRLALDVRNRHDDVVAGAVQREREAEVGFGDAASDEPVDVLGAERLELIEEGADRSRGRAARSWRRPR